MTNDIPSRDSLKDPYEEMEKFFNYFLDPKTSLIRKLRLKAAYEKQMEDIRIKNLFLNEFHKNPHYQTGGQDIWLIGEKQDKAIIKHNPLNPVEGETYHVGWFNKPGEFEASKEVQVTIKEDTFYSYEQALIGLLALRNGCGGSFSAVAKLLEIPLNITQQAIPC